MRRGVLVISKECWSDTRWARKQWLPFFLAEHDGIDCVKYFNRHRAWWRGESRDVTGGTAKLTVRQETLLCPGERWPLVRDLNRAHVARRMCADLDGEHEWLTIFYHPWDASMMPWLSHRSRVMFDWTEDWATFHDVPHLGEAQRRAVCQSECVIAVSEALCELAAEWRGSDRQILLLPNATALEAGGVSELPEELKQIDTPRIGFVGHAGPWFDLQMVNQLVPRQPSWQWVFVGGVEEEVRMALGKWPSVHFLGVRRPMELLGLMQHCDVLVAPYKQGIRGDASKLYDYLAAGSPIVSIACEAAERLRPCVRMAEGPEAWEHAIAGILRDRVRMPGECARLAAENHWRERAATLIRFWSDCASG